MSKYTTYQTKAGRPIKAYVAECIGKTLNMGADGTMRGKDGTIGSYATGEEAIAAAKKEKDSTCTARVTDTRAEKVIYQA